ncbi:MAG: hypothetical protein IJA52_03185 [Clostridia bacterium]|nr:hypothetical protein [Clostridia bacterium]
MKLIDIISYLESEDYATKMNNIINGLQYLGNTVLEAYKVWDEWFEKAAPKLEKIISSISVAGLSEDEKQKLKDSYTEWGKYGWSYNTTSRYNDFSNFPISLEYADEFMGKYCTDEEIINIKTKLSECELNINDLDEALFCFQQGKYKSCVLILFSLIDNLLIRRNKTFIDKKDKKVKVRLGGSAIKAVKEDSESDFEKGILFSHLIFLNTLTCLSKIFEYGNNFEDQPKIINRNFVSHGMYEREVSRIDCFKVWSALYSFAVIYPTVESYQVEIGRMEV